MTKLATDVLLAGVVPTESNSVIDRRGNNHVPQTYSRFTSLL